ncbi:MAG: DUF2207 domain-containing protein [Nitrospirae bacterium]|nr:DUF2207 domain-containing protein [Nitrospirota bacterium]
MQHVIKYDRMRYACPQLICREIFVSFVTLLLIAFSLLFGILYFPADAAADLDDNLKGVPPSAPSEWRYYGISADESKQWIQEGIIFAGWAAQWKGEGFSAGSAGKWHRIVNVYTAGDFLKNGFGPEEAREWMDHGIKSGQRAREYLSAGLDAGEAGTFWKKGLFPDEAKKWRDAGFDADAMLAWHYGPRMSEFYFTKDTRYSQTVYDIEFARSWRVSGFTAEEAHMAGTYGFELSEAKRWKEAGFSFNESVLWKDSGFTLEEALKNREAGLSPTDAELRRYESSDKGDEITGLDADITVKNDGTLEVIETATIIDRPGGEYKEGYHKSLQMWECRASNSQSIFPSPRMHVKSIEVDGQPGSHYISAGLLHFKIKDAPLPEGEHKVVIKYNTDVMIMNNPRHDELCFVIAGRAGRANHIRGSTATVRLPKGADVIFAGGYAGLRDRKDVGAEVEETGQGDIVRYFVKRPLREGMIFSVDIGFVKGYARASWLQRLVLLDRQTRRLLSSLFIFFSGLVVSFIYYWTAWVKVGRDPKGQGVELTEFSPPADIDPAGMRALLKKGKADHLSTTAAILSLAERGYIRIFEWEGAYKIQRTQAIDSQVSDREKTLLSTLFSERNMVVLTGSSERKLLSRAGRTLKTLLKKEYGKQTEQNIRYLWPGIVISVLFLLASLAVIDKSELVDRSRATTGLAVYASILCAGFGLLTLLFSRLLRRPAKGYVDLLEQLHSYAGFLKRNFTNLNAQKADIPPFLQEHLPYAIAAGVDVSHLLIRNGEAKWYKGTSGGFGCGDFIRTVKRSS